MIYYDEDVCGLNCLNIGILKSLENLLKEGDRTQIIEFPDKWSAKANWVTKGYRLI